MSQRTGYLFVDHRASPGIPEDVALKLGMDPVLVAGGKLLETDTLTCVHCKTVAWKNHWRTREREKCSKCSFHYVCDYCYADMQRPDYDHTPYEKVVESIMTKGIDPRNTPFPLIKGA